MYMSVQDRCGIHTQNLVQSIRTVEQPPGENTPRWIFAA
jgi:hypothetical protein